MTKKETELNTTIVLIVAIGCLVTFFIAFVMPTINNSHANECSSSNIEDCSK